MAETWIMNESPSVLIYSTNINFVSNGNNYTSISVDEPFNFAVDLYYGATRICGWYRSSFMDDWLDQAYRTVTFDASPTGDLLTWLQSNAVKQQPEPTEETWVINESPDVSVEKTFNVFFYSGDYTFTHNSINIVHGSGLPIKQYLKYDSMVVYTKTILPASETWEDDALRTLTFDTAPTGELLTWLLNNARKKLSLTVTDYSLSSLPISLGKHKLAVKSKIDSYLPSDSAEIEYIKN